MIELKGVTQSYHNRVILDQISLSVGKNERCALVGRNGAGKSTLIHTLLGLLPIKHGEIKLNGIPVKEPRWKKAVSYLPEKFQLYPHLTAYENMSFFASLAEFKQDEKKIEETMKLVSLWDARDQLTNSFSKGMLQRLGIGIMLYYDTPILILDEPTSGLDPFGRIELLSLLQSFKNKTILFSSHHIDEIKQVCTHVAYLKDTKMTKYEVSQFEEQMMLGEAKL
jgi:ABC-2 type transport system ATP-binding protein